MKKVYPNSKDLEYVSQTNWHLVNISDHDVLLQHFMPFLSRTSQI